MANQSQMVVLIYMFFKRTNHNVQFSNYSAQTIAKKGNFNLLKKHQCFEGKG